MKEQIEIYVRDSHRGTLLNFYVPARLREQFIASIKEGAFASDMASIALELAVLPKWATDAEERKELEKRDAHHVRIPITAINVHFNE